MQRPSVSAAPSTKTTEIKTKDIPNNTDNTLEQDVQKTTSKTMESEEARKRRRIDALLKRIEEKKAIGPTEVMGPQVCNVAPPETTEKNEEENADTCLPVDEDNTAKSMTKVASRRFKCFPSIFRRFYRKDPGPSQAPEEPPLPASTTKEPPQIIKTGPQNVPDIKQIFCREEEFEPHDEGSWEEYQTYFHGGVPVPDSRHTIASTMVGSYVAQVGDTDVEQQQQELDSKESYPHVIEVQQWEKRKVPSTIAPAIDMLYLRPPTSSSDEDYVPDRRKKRKIWSRHYY